MQRLLVRVRIHPTPMHNAMIIIANNNNKSPESSSLFAPTIITTKDKNKSGTLTQIPRMASEFLRVLSSIWLSSL